MSDTNLAVPPSQSGPLPGEVAINPNPVTPPAPLADHVPDRAEQREPPRYNSRREAIQAAYKKAEAKGRPGAAEAKAGHNQPPEEMPEEEKLNLRKRPEDQPQRPRGEHGHFTRADNEPQSGRPAGRQAGPQGQRAPWHAPLPRMSEAAKREWHAAPESVRADVHRMNHEFARAYQHMRRTSEAMRPITPYHQMAQRQGTTLEQALRNYTGIEEKLRADPIGGLDVIVNNLNLRTQDGRRLGLADVAYHVLNKSPEQHQLQQAQNTQMAMAQQMQQLRQQQQAIARQQARMQYEHKFRQTRSAVDRFAETNPRLDELGDIIERELRLGFSLPVAYRRACLLRPGTAAQTRGTQAPQTRAVNRSISGAPDSGPANGQSRPRKPVSRREAISSAIRHVNGSL